MSTDTSMSAQSTESRMSVVPPRRRAKDTSAWVHISERIASIGITAGGLLVIFAVVLIVAFLVKVAAPLALGGEVYQQRAYQVQPPKELAWVSTDDYLTLGTRIAADGAFSVFHLDTGRAVSSGSLDFDGQRATAVGAVVRGDQLAFGFEDGSVRFATLGYDASVITPDALPGVREPLNERDAIAGDAIYSVLPGEQFRKISVAANVGEPQAISERPIIAVDYRVGGTVERPTRSFVTFDSDGVGRLSRAETRINLMTRAERTTVTTATLPTLPPGTVVTEVAMTSIADSVYVATEKGIVYRFDTRSFNEPVLAETTRVFPEDVQITAMGFLVGEQALVLGGSNGAVDVYFRLQEAGADTVDGNRMVKARSHAPQAAAIHALAVSSRSKTFATQDANGEVWVRHSTSDQVLFRFQSGTAAVGIPSLVLAPRVDGALSIDASGAANFWAFDYPHPETTLKSIFGKLWYEGYSEPTYTWQSSSGTDVFEAKFSLVPLIFGTLKATVYSLIFAIPIALLAAIYTSEFLHRRIRAGVKPMMEMMESLPTVVLGFVAALILAPIVETWIAAVLLVFAALPISLMLAAYLWQMLPAHIALRLQGTPKLILMMLVIIGSLYASYALGPAFERVFFYGDFKAWTNGDIGTGAPFLFLVGLPLSFLLVTWVFRRVAGTRYRLSLRERDKRAAAVLDFSRWVLMLVAAGVLSFIVASLLTALGYDPRGGVVDTYVQRNALVVGFVMGFAVIPNIYTLAEDALNSVPNDLRAASLATGATPWQTAMWVVLPTAMSGVFAACMIGMGRAVGETMIVVMAAGNTPVLDWNVFNGLRTLSANIAVELPEAVKDGTLYRMLFLAAVTLFSMTFVINTIAEIIRQRFRKRAFQL